MNTAVGQLLTREFNPPPGVTKRNPEPVSSYPMRIYFIDATLAGAFVARWCVASKVETEGGLFRVRDDELAPRLPRPLITRPSNAGLAPKRGTASAISGLWS